MKHFEQQIRDSVKRDFANAYYKRRLTTKSGRYKVIKELRYNSEYERYRKFLIGKQVKIISEGQTGTWVEFVNDTDRQNLNKVAGWSEKKQYLINAIFEDL